MLTFHNTLTKKKEIFEPLHIGKVGMYTCGPTVYGKIHIGNLRAYVLADLIRRLLTHEGYEVRAIKNITDVGHLTADDIAQGDSGEDKIEKKARAEHKTPQEIADFYEDYFHRTEEQMNILPAHFFPQATKHIPQMIRLIESLIEQEYAYEKNGNVFLDVTAFADYGKLSGNTLDKLKVGARLEEHPDKRHPWDFALWLKAPADHLMKWPSPWSTGYPGWHIECSAMSMEYLGDTLDIHTGGEDNIFPHHEAEIVQSEGVTHQPFARYWIHNRHLLVDGVKMSKSKGNLYTFEDILDRGYSAMDLRMLLLLSHYRSQMNFTWEALDQAKANWQTIQTFHDRLIEACHCDPALREGQGEAIPNSKNESLKEEIATSRSATADGTRNDGYSFSLETFQKSFLEALEDDLNTPQAITILLDTIKQANRALDEGVSFDIPALAGWLDTVVNNLLGLRWEYTDDQTVPQTVLDLAAQREQARTEKNFSLADTLREEIEKTGFTIEDTATGTKVRKA
ncbi:MAG: cysteine--tRNA ligase [Candidatus Moraniibacteriota bacterium]